MEKMYVLKECSNLISRTVKDREGRDTTIESFEVVLTDGIDTVLAETSKSVTIQMKENPIEPNSMVSAAVRLQVVDYEKDKKKGRFFKALLIDCKPL